MTRTQRRTRTIALTLGLSLALAACGGTTQDSVEDDTPDPGTDQTQDTDDGAEETDDAAAGDGEYAEGLAITMLPKSVNNPYFETSSVGAEAVVTELGGTYEYTGPSDASASSQVSYINTLSQQGVDAILLSANDPNALCSSLDQASAGGAAIVTFDSDARKATFDKLKADIEAMEPIVTEIGKKIKKQTELIGKMVEESSTDIDSDDFDVDVASRVAIRIGMALAAADEAYAIIATELARDAGGVVVPAIRDDLLELWKPWAQPFKDLGADSGNLLNKFGKVFGVSDLVGDLSRVIELDREGGGFKLVAKIDRSGTVTLGAIRLDQLSFEAFLQFSDREVANPTAEEKELLVQRGEKFYIGDVAILGGGAALLDHAGDVLVGLDEDPHLGQSHVVSSSSAWVSGQMTLSSSSLGLMSSMWPPEVA